MNYSSTDIFQGSRMTAVSAEANASERLSKKIKDMTVLTEQVKKTYDAAVQDMHHQNVFSDKTLELEASFDKVSTFLKQNSKILNQDQDIQKLVQEHMDLSSTVLNVYQKGIEALASQDKAKMESSLSDLEKTSSDLASHINHLENKLAATVNEAGNTAAASLSQNVDIFITILILTNNAYKMAISIGELQAKISASLNDVLGQLNDLLALTNRLNKFYQDAAVYIAKNGKPEGQAPNMIKWGLSSDGTINGVKWTDVVDNLLQPTPRGGLPFTQDELDNNPLIKQFVEEYKPPDGSKPNPSTYYMGPADITNAIKYVSQQMSGLMPNDANTDYGSFYADHNQDPFDSTNTNSFIQAIGKQTEMLQSKLSAVANTVSLSQQNAAQIVTIFQQILNLQSGLISKM
jgi:hypothetical protein